jgi:hypothetical protein
MKFQLRVAILALAAAALVLPSDGARAQSAARNDKIQYQYVPPMSLKYLATMERLKQFRFLEQLSDFLSPVRLPHNFNMVTMECGYVNAQYIPSLRQIRLCYEYVEAVERVGPKIGETSDFSYEEVVVGGLVGVILHELGHAVFDMLEVPVMGREEDAADQISTFIALQFNRDVARTVVRGNAYIYKVWYDFGAPAFFDEHGTGLQRYYNSLCIAAGFDPMLVKDLTDKDEMPKQRLANCPAEYAQAQRAFEKTILPFVDREQMKRVQSTQWLRFTPQQIALLKQQQARQKQTLNLALCNGSAARNVRVALVYRPANDPRVWQAQGWFGVPDQGCQIVGTIYGDAFYFYAEGNGGNFVWSADEKDQSASKQCIDSRKAFLWKVGGTCQGEQTLVGFRRWSVDPTASSATLTLTGSP